MGLACSRDFSHHVRCDWRSTRLYRVGANAPDTTSFNDALSTIRKYGVQPAPAILKRLEAGARGQIPENPKPGDAVFQHVDNRIIANNRLLVDSASKKAKEELGFNTLILGTELEGEAKDAARFLP